MKTTRYSWMTVLILCSPLSAACSKSDDKSPAAVADAGSGTGTATGMVDSRAFDTVSASWWIGSPDDPKRTRVIYVFDKPVTCDDISKAGWDTVVTDHTQSLEIKLIGTEPAKYPIPANGRPATGEADVNYTLTATTGTPSEIGATAGNVTLEDITAGTADGSFTLTFDTGKVSGDFHAIYCKDGHEP